MKRVFAKLIDDHKQRMSFCVLVSFLSTFIIARCYVTLAHSGWFEDPYLYIRGYHIHHLNYGIVIMAIAGFMSLVLQNATNRLKIGVLYGIGLGLTFDEFGMWLKLEDDYWTRMSYDAVVVIAIIFCSIVYFPSLWMFFLDKGDKKIKQLKQYFKK